MERKRKGDSLMEFLFGRFWAKKPKLAHSSNTGLLSSEALCNTGPRKSESVCQPAPRPVQHSSEVALQRWGKLNYLLMNRKQQFRFTANLSKRYEATVIRRSNAESLRVAVLVWLAALKCIEQCSEEEIGDYQSAQVSYAGSCSTDRTDDPMTGVETHFSDTCMGETPASSASTVQSECWLDIKLNYGDEFFKFRLSDSSGILELSQEVSQRLNLEGGGYDVKYLDDDNDWILIRCDDDLREYILSSMRKEQYTLKMCIDSN